MQVVNCRTRNALANDVSIADTLFSRMKGLLGRSDLPSGKGLWIRPCKGIHTFCMKFPIDVIFLDKSNRIISLVEELQPNRMTKVLPGATSVIELPAGTLKTTKTSIGDEVVIA